MRTRHSWYLNSDMVHWQEWLCRDCPARKLIDKHTGETIISRVYVP